MHHMRNAEADICPQHSTDILYELRKLQGLKGSSSIRSSTGVMRELSCEQIPSSYPWDGSFLHLSCDGSSFLVPGCSPMQPCTEECMESQLRPCRKCLILDAGETKVFQDVTLM